MAHLFVDDIIDGEDAHEQAADEIGVCGSRLGGGGGIAHGQALCQQIGHGGRQVQHAHVRLGQKRRESLLHLRVVPAPLITRLNTPLHKQRQSFHNLYTPRSTQDRASPIQWASILQALLPFFMFPTLPCSYTRQGGYFYSTDRQEGYRVSGQIWGLTRGSG